MSRKSSWWLRPQRKGASNRAALNEAKYFMEHNKVLRERISELTAENDKLRWLVRHLYDYRQTYFETGIYPTDHGVTERYMRDLGVEVDG